MKRVLEFLVAVAGTLILPLAAGAANLSVVPNTSGTDNLIGATNAQWVISVTTTQPLAAGDVVQVWFPSNINMVSPSGQFQLNGASVTATSGIQLYSSLGTQLSNLISNSSFESGTTSWSYSLGQGPTTTWNFASITSTASNGSQALFINPSAGNYAQISSAVQIATNSPFAVSFYAKGTTSTDYARLMLVEETICGGGNLFAYNFQSSVWECTNPMTYANSSSPYAYNFNLTGSYQRFSFVTTSPATSTYQGLLKVYLTAGATDSLAEDAVFLDAVQAEMGSSPTTYNLGGTGDSTVGVSAGGQGVIYGYVNTTTPAGNFSFTLGGISNPSGMRSALQNLTWAAKAGTLSEGAPGFSDTLQTTKFNATTSASVVRGGGNFIVDEYTGNFLSGYNTGTPSNYSFRFTPSTSIPIGGKIFINFPIEYSDLLGNINVSTTQRISIGETTASTLGSLATSSINLQMVTSTQVILTVAGEAVQAGDPLSVTINNVTNPSTAGVYGADSAGPGGRFVVYTAKSNSGLLDGSLFGQEPGDFQNGPPPASSVIIGGKHTLNIWVRVKTATTTRDLIESEKDLLEVGMGSPDKGYFIGMKRLDSNSQARYTGLLDGNYRAGAMLLNKSSTSSYDSLLSPGFSNFSLLNATAMTVTSTIYFGVPDATTTVTLTGGVPGQQASVLATSPNYQSFGQIFTTTDYATPGFASNGTGYARIKVKSGENWSFNVMGGSTFGESTNFSSGTVKYWPPSINSIFIGASGTTDLGSYSYTQADKTLVVSLMYAGTSNPVTNACVGVKRSGGGFMMGPQDMICQPNGTGGNANKYVFQVPSGAVSVDVSQPGKGEPAEYPVAITGSTVTKTIYLSGANNYISVTVQDSSGNSIQNASVFANGSAGFGQGMTGSTGTTTIYVPVGTYTLNGFAPGVGPLGSQSATVAQGSNPSVTFTINSNNLRTVRGNVSVGGTGQPGIKIGAWGTGTTYGGNGTETDSSGDYTLYLPSGTYNVGGWSDDTGGLSPQSVDLTSGNASGVNWTFSGGFGTLRINIANSQNISQLFAGAFNPNSGRGNGTNSWTASGTSKYADIKLPAGDYKANAGSPLTGPIIDGEDVTVLAGQTVVVNGDAQASASLVNITGTVEASSVGIEGVNVWASRMNGPGFYSTQTDSNGQYTLTVPASRSYMVGVKDIGYVADEGDISQTVTTTTSTLNFTLVSAGSAISGQVSSGGTALTEGWVSAKKITNSGREVWTGTAIDNGGNYSINVDSGSTWTVYADAPGYERSSGTSVAAGGTGNISLTAKSNWSKPNPVVQGITNTSGGQMTTANASLDIPANALGTDNSVVSVSITTATPKSAPNAAGLSNSVISVTAMNGNQKATLSGNITLSLSLNQDDLTELKIPESQLQLAYFDGTTGKWEPIAATVDTVNHKITANTNHFTDFAPIEGGPDAPTGLSATAASASQNNLSWTAPIATTSYYAIYATTTAITAFPTSTLIATSTSNSYSHTGLSAATTWYYKVAGVNSLGEGPNSNRASATTQNASNNSNNNVSTGGGGSIITPTPPTLGGSPVTIVGGASASTRTITLNFNVSNASLVTVSEDQNFAGGSWLSYKPSIQFVMSEGIGPKKIFIKFRSAAGGDSAVQTLVVNYNPAASSSDQNQSGTFGQESVKTADSPTAKSQIAINAPSLNYQPGGRLQFTYKYTNQTKAVQKISVVRQILNEKGKAVRTASAVNTLKPGGSFDGKVNELLSKGLPVGGYSVVVSVYDSKTKKLLDQNKFEIQIAENKIEKAATVSSRSKFTRLLNLRSSGEEVKLLQQKLKDLGYYDYGVTGYFGPITKAAVIKFQKAYGLAPYPGWVGPGTREKLNNL